MLSVWTCRQGVEAGADGGAPPTAVERFQAVCGNCHALPSPADLPRAVWAEVVLPRMGQFLGHYASPTQREELLSADPQARSRLEAAQVYPAGPTVSQEDWLAVQEWVLAQAPDSLLMPDYPRGPTATLAAQYPDFFLSPPSGTYVAVPREGGVVMADINKGMLFSLDGGLSPKQQVAVGSGLTDISYGRAGAFATVIGSFSPTDAGLGTIVEFADGRPRTVGTGLRRPTSLIALDLDDDPEEELVVTEFGKWTGGLSRWDRQSDGRYTRSDLSSQTGATQVLALPGPGRSFLVLYAQGKEEVIRYTVGASGGVAAESVLRFPPSWGSSSLKLVDFDADGIQDLLYTCGDGADYISDPKPYHGVRVFRGAADGTYAEARFWPLPGAYDAELGDFDGDGDVDLAAISFFPDYRQPEPYSAVLFENDGSAAWPLRPLPGSDRGRFIRLAAGDVNGDGRPDLVATTLAMEPVPDNGRLAGWVQQGLPLVMWVGR